MRHQLTPENKERFLERFGHGHDGILHDVQLKRIVLDNHKESFNRIYTAVVTLGIKDQERDDDDRWRNITIEVEDVTVFSAKKSENSDFAVVFRLNVDFFGGDIYLDFFPFTSEPSGPEDYGDKPGINNRTMLVISGKRCFWTLSEYSVWGVDR